MQEYDVDVAVVGAGPAGAHVASIMARGGLTTLLLDRQGRGRAGAQWFNAVATWLFDEADVPRPLDPPEIEPFIIVPPAGGRRTVIHGSDAPDLDMRALGRRLLESFEEQPSAEALWETNLTDLELDSRGRPTVLRGHGVATATTVSVRARLFVDASGLSALLRRQSPLDALCPRPATEDLCGASQAVYAIGDPHGAEHFLREREARAGEALSYVGIEGGYSLLRINVDRQLREVSILTGSIVGAKVASSESILRRFVDSQPWVGERIRGGARAIPLGRPYTHLIAPGLALLGDAAGQVFATHGSGIGIGLVAAKLLGDTVVRAHHAGRDIGELDALWPYPRTFHRRWGGLLGASDAFRRFSQKLTPHEARDLFDSGILTESMLRDGLEQREMSVGGTELPRLMARAALRPWLSAMLLPVLARMPLISLLAHSYPMEPPEDTPALARYERLMAQLVDTV